jgi:phospholipid/cholesterol/gamma-HCH transport system ATP-binding protein
MKQAFTNVDSTSTTEHTGAPSTVISLRGIAKSFSERVVLHGIDLDVAKGETLVVIGKSGTGKSVLLKIVAGLMKPDSGHVTIDGTRLDHADRETTMTLRRRMGFVFQGAALFDSLTIAQNVGLGLSETTKKYDEEIAAIVQERLEWVGLQGQGDKLPSQLSGGMRKRASLARAIAMDPEIVLYDEPTTGLDPITSEGINDLIVSLRERLHVTAIAVTHDMHSAFKIGDRIAMLDEGKIVFNGLASDAASSDSSIVRQFITGQNAAPTAPA